MEVIVSLKGNTQAQHRFRQMASNTETLLPVWAEVSAALAKAEERSWGKGVTLVSSTVEKKAREGRTDPLVETGRLKDSLTHAVGGPGAVRQTLPYEMRFGTQVFYARFLQHGTKNMNRKRVMRLGIAQRQLISTLVMRHLTNTK